MANEIYDSTWWGNTIQTASSIGTSTEMIQGQFNLTKLGDELVTNGDFSNGGANWQSFISGSSTVVFTDVATLNIDASNSNVGIYQENVFESGKQYKIVIKMKASSEFNAEVLESQGGATRANIGQVSLTTSYKEFTFYHTAIGVNDIFIHRLFSGSGANESIIIDNVSVKEVRAEEVEAVKCLADAIHRIGIQDIQN